MKKVYEKPAIVFEAFSLSTAIAGSCGVTTNTPSSGSCGIEFGGDMIFLSEMTGCSEEVDDNGEYKICYHVPTDGNNLFNS